jgi:hypothetical protein
MSLLFHPCHEDMPVEYLPPGTQSVLLGLKPGKLAPGGVYFESTAKDIETVEQA